MDNPVLEAIEGRRSIRGYAAEPLESEQLAQLVGAALSSPSANNFQPWHFSVVRDRALLDRVNAAAHERAREMANPSPRFADPAFDVFYGAPTVFFIATPLVDGAPSCLADAGIAAQTLALAAYGLGLGSVILGLPRLAFQTAQAGELRRALAFPQDYDFALAVAVGQGAMTKPAHQKHPEKVAYIG